MVAFRGALVAALLSAPTAQAFQIRTPSPLGVRTTLSESVAVAPLAAVAPRNIASEDTDDYVNQSSRKSRIMRALKSRGKHLVKPTAAFLVAAAFVSTTTTTPAHASAPVMAIPKGQQRDSIADALKNADKKQIAVKQAQLAEQAAKAREIEATQGEAARVAYEEQLQQAEKEAAAQKKVDIEALQRSLLDQGIDPFGDQDGRREMIKLEKGVDLAKIPGNVFYSDAKLAAKGRVDRTYAGKKMHNRRIIKAMVTDMKNRGIDPLDYFKTHSTTSMQMRELPAEQAAQLADVYEANLAKYGQISPPPAGEMSVKERQELEAADPKAAKKAAKEAAKKAKQEAKARKQAEKVAQKAAAATATSGGASVATTETVTAPPAATPEVAPEDVVVTDNDLMLDDEDEDFDESAIDPATAAAPVTAVATSNGIPITKIAAGVTVVGGGGFAIKIYQDKERMAEDERKRQLKILMGEADVGRLGPPAGALDADIIIDPTDSANGAASSAPPPSMPSAPPPESLTAPKKKKKKKRGGIFGKKRNSRETDLTVLMGPTSKAPGLATLLAKILTFGAPGRFPQISGDMPFSEFNLDVAKEKLEIAQKASGLTKIESAELFANVVNCMLIDIVDLASTSLKEKETSVTIDAINIMVDFMNHAASLYDALAEGVVIKPVTYGGTLSKSKLEDMYSTYAVSAMTNMENISDDFEKRVALLQDVFEINEKKAEGLMMKAVQKNMMNMLKNGEGMEGMQEMLGGMGGDMGDMAGLMGGADGEGPSPEQLKEMLLTLKEMKDSGSIPPGEMEAVKSQFKEAFGSGINDVIKDADAEGGELSGDDKELLDLMKSILDD